MTQDAHIRETHPPASLIALAMAPVVMLIVWLQHFAGMLVDLKQIRRSNACERAGWREGWAEFRRSEWWMVQVLGEGARRLLAGEEIRLADIGCIYEPPAGFEPHCPADPWAMLQRCKRLAAYQADPEAFIRRHAARILARAAACVFAAPCDDADIDVDPYPLSSPGCFVASAQRVRGPP